MEDIMRHFNLDLSEDLADRIAAVAVRNQISKTEALLRALDLLFVTDEVKAEDGSYRIGVIRKNDVAEWEVVGEIVGV
jgi:hypothetical protein